MSSRNYNSYRWLKFAGQMRQSAGWKCERCGIDGDSHHVHHKEHIDGRELWEYDRSEIEVLCIKCHAKEHAERSRKK